MTEPSFKIKIPAKATAELVTKTASVSRRAVKRRITSDDESDDSPPPSRQTSTPTTAKTSGSVATSTKKKLPPIKKKQKTDSASTSTVASPAPVPAVAPKPASKSSAILPKPSAPSQAGLPKKPQAPVQATTMNASGTGDFDLRDTNTWRSLIGKGPSSSGPRVGVEKRVSTEERRKQLDKMRDAARLAREQHNSETFDLQAQSRKIAAFEKKLQHDHRVKINGPHILGAAFAVRPVPGMRPR